MEPVKIDEFGNILAKNVFHEPKKRGRRAAEKNDKSKEIFYSLELDGTQGKIKIKSLYFIKSQFVNIIPSIDNL